MKCYLSIFLAILMLSLTSADIISMNSGGSNISLINPESHIEGFLFDELTVEQIIGGGIISNITNLTQQIPKPPFNIGFFDQIRANTMLFSLFLFIMLLILMLLYDYYLNKKKFWLLIFGKRDEKTIYDRITYK